MKMQTVMRVALVALLVGLQAPALWAESSKKAPPVPNRAGIYENLDFFGVQKCVINDSTTAVLCTASEGFLDAVCAFGGLSDQYSLALDSGVAGTRSVTNSDSLIISPMVWTNQDTKSLNGGAYCYNSKLNAGGPVRFVNGLVGVQSHSGHSSIFYYHLSDGSNP